VRQTLPFSDESRNSYRHDRDDFSSRRRPAVGTLGPTFRGYLSARAFPLGSEPADERAADIGFSTGAEKACVAVAPSQQSLRRAIVWD